MPKLSRFKLSDGTKNKLIREFWFAVSETNDVETVEHFFKKLLTPTEVLMISKRLEVLKYLLLGNPYDYIRSNLRVTDATIAKMSNLLHEEDSQFLKVLQKLYLSEKTRLEIEISKRKHPPKGSKKLLP